MAMRIDGPIPEWMLEKFPELRDVANPAKLRNIKTTVDGITFASRKEANRYQELLLEKRAGIVLEIELQPKFLLQEGYRDNGKWVRPIVYIADFRVVYADGRVVVIDVKGFKTKDYRMKKKLFRKRYPEIVFVEE